MVRTTVKDIANRAGVSICTVSKVLNGLAKEARIPEERARTILRIADEMNYRPSAAARAIRTQQNHQVGVLLRNVPADRMSHPLVFETILGINEGLDEAGYVVSIIRLDDVTDIRSKRGRVLRENILDGIIILDLVPESLKEQVSRIAAQCIYVDSAVYNSHNCIRRNEYAAGRLVAEKMVELGYRRLSWFNMAETPGKSGYSLRERIAGITDVAHERGVQMRQLLIPPNQQPPAAASLPAFSRDMAVITNDLYMARWLSHTCNSMGLLPGYDFGLASCDGAQDTYRNWPGLSRVNFNRFDMGYKASHMMLQLLGNPRHPVPSFKVVGEWIAGNTAWGPQADRAALRQFNPF